MSHLYLSRPERLPFRFSLRTFLLLLTVFGVWLGVQVKWVRDRHDALEWLRSGRISSPWLRNHGSYISSPSPYLPHYRTKEFESLFPEARVKQQHVVEQ